MSRAVASSQPIANEPTRKRSPAKDATISIPKPPMLHANAVPFDRSLADRRAGHAEADRDGHQEHDLAEERGG